jgi:hypothetical protein
VAWESWEGRQRDITDCAIDLRPGGRCSITQRSPDGGLHPTGGPDGTVVVEAEHHVRLVPREEGTELTLEIRILIAGPECEGFGGGV